MVPYRLLLLYCIVLLCPATGRGQADSAYAPCQEMPALLQQFGADFQSVNRFYSPPAAGNLPAAGRGAAGSTLYTPEKSARLDRLYGQYLSTLERVDFAGLPQECKADYLLFKRDLEEKRRLLAREAAAHAAIREWFPFRDRIDALARQRRRGVLPDAQAVARDFAGITKSLDTLLPRVGSARLSITSIRKAVETATAVQATLRGIYDFYNGYDPAFTWWVPKAYAALDQRLTDYAAAFNGRQVADSNGITPREPVGRDELVALLRYEMIAYTPEELTAIANEEFAWCERELLKVSKEMGFGNNWMAAVERVKNTYVPPGKQPEAILKLYNESIDFIKQRRLITIPPLAEEVWGMNMMSAERQRTNAFFTGGADITISYPTTTMDHAFRMMSMRGNNPNFSRATVHHELIPGHNLQYFMNARNRTYRAFSTPFWGEGWALYWELLLWDLKFPQTPEEKVGMLFWHMHRCARIIFSFQFHTGQWTPQQCIDFLVEKVGHERANAESEIRGPLSSESNPLYQVAYLTGGRQFYALKKELVDSGRMTYQQFHDAVMGLNAMPVEMVRAILVNAPLTKEYVPSWKFHTVH